MTSDEYRKAFGLLEAASAISPRRALLLALDIRKFEIELYWKRATYFWAFLAVTFAGYFSLLVTKFDQSADRGEAMLTVLSLGLVFSVAWYFVNRASKFWQSNWEAHVDLLENVVVGPLYKTILKDADISFLNWSGAYQFSVSKINQILSFYVMWLLGALLCNTLIHYYRLGCPFDSFATGIVFLTVLAITALYWKGKSGSNQRSIQAVLRSTAIKPS